MNAMLSVCLSVWHNQLNIFPVKLFPIWTERYIHNTITEELCQDYQATTVTTVSYSNKEIFDPTIVTGFDEKHDKKQPVEIGCRLVWIEKVKNTKCVFRVI